jgi:iron complex transport system permease protein
MSPRTWLIVSAAVFVGTAVVLPFIGPSALDLAALVRRQEPVWSIFVQLRVSRTLLGLFAGAALSLGGALFQAMLRDALATPYTLGVSTGASLGAVIAMSAGWSSHGGLPPTWIGALAGGTVTLALVVAVTTTRDGLAPYRLLLAGIATNSVCAALILLVFSVSSVSSSFAITRWLIGSLDAIPFPPLAVFVALTVMVGVVIVREGRSWTLLSISEAWAATRGVHVWRLTAIGYVVGSALTAVTVAVAGPIGFIGLMVPHLIRMRVSSDARILMPCAFCFGGVMLAACDALGRTVAAPAEVPAGAITACIGGPYLVWLVRRR